MSTAGQRCGVDAYASLVEQLTGEIFPLMHCDDPAAYTAILRRERAGLTLRVDVPVCELHDRLLSRMPDWQRSLKLRAPVST